MQRVVVLLMDPLTANMLRPSPAAIEIVAMEIGVSKRGSSSRMAPQVRSTRADPIPQISTCGVFGKNGGATRNRIAPAA